MLKNKKLFLLCLLLNLVWFRALLQAEFRNLDIGSIKNKNRTPSTSKYFCSIIVCGWFLTKLIFCFVIKQKKIKLFVEGTNLKGLIINVSNTVNPHFMFTYTDPYRATFIDLLFYRGVFFIRLNVQRVDKRTCYVKIDFINILWWSARR